MCFTIFSYGIIILKKINPKLDLMKIKYGVDYGIVRQLFLLQPNTKINTRYHCKDECAWNR